MMHDDEQLVIFNAFEAALLVRLSFVCINTNFFFCIKLLFFLLRKLKAV